jgi:hypothetical protein
MVFGVDVTNAFLAIAGLALLVSKTRPIVNNELIGLYEVFHLSLDIQQVFPPTFSISRTATVDHELNPIELLSAYWEHCP